MSHLSAKDELRRFKAHVAALGSSVSSRATLEPEQPAVPAPPDISLDAPEPPRGAAYWLAGSAGWMFSAATHGMLIVILGLTVLAPDSVGDLLGVQMAIAEREANTPFDSPAVELDALSSEPTSGGADASAALHPASLDPLAQAALDVEASSLVVSGGNIVDDVATMIGDGRDLGLEPIGDGDGSGSGRGKGHNGKGDGNGYAMFYGSEARGESFAFVVDCSQSMTGWRFERACAELMRAIISLDSDQKFYVVFFNTEAFPQYFPVVDKFLAKADAQTIDKLGTWMRNVIPMGGTEPSTALRRAIELEPDAIFLLSDGEFDLRPCMQVLMDHQHARTVVHTVALGSTVGERMLVALAQATGGTYRVADVGP